jgi:hypothetical protein
MELGLPPRPTLLDQEDPIEDAYQNAGSRQAGASGTTTEIVEDLYEEP